MRPSSDANLGAWDNTVRLAWTGLLAAVLLAAVVGEFRSAINSDTAWTAAVSSRMLEGQRLYVTILEINPPLINWLYLPVAWLSRVSSVAAATIVRIIVYGIAIGSMALTAGIVTAIDRRPGAWRATAAAIAIVFAALPLGAFTERDHLIVMLLTPLVAATGAHRLAVPLRLRTRIVAGGAGAVGLALKPYFVPLWLMLVVLRWRGARRPVLLGETWIVIAIGLTYALAVAVSLPEYFQMVSVLGSSYGKFMSRGIQGVLVGAPEFYLFLGAMVAWWVRRPRQGDALAAALAAAAAGSLVAVLWQGKGWFYHFYPVAAFSMLLGIRAAFMPASIGTSLAQRAARMAALGAFVVGGAPVAARVMVVGAERAGGDSYPRNREIGALAAQLARHRELRSAQVLSSDISPTFPLMERAGLLERHSLPCLWVPMTVYRGRWVPGGPIGFNPPPEMGPAERLAFDAVVGDVVNGAPDVIIVESRRRNEDRSGYPGGFDHLSYYAQDTSFASALRKYRPGEMVEGFRFFFRAP